MRISTTAVGISLAGLALGACSGSGKSGDAGGNTAGASGTTASAVSAPAMPKPGLWQMTVSADGMPKPMMTQMCVGTPQPGANPFSPPPQAGQACTKNSFTKTATGYSIDSECKMNGMTMIAKGDVTGDFSSAYKIAMKTKMSGPNIPPTMQTERVSTVEAKYAGACPAGMTPGMSKQAG